MCRLRNIVMRDFQESVPTGQTDTGQSDPYVPLSFGGDTKMYMFKVIFPIQVISQLVERQFHKQQHINGLILTCNYLK